MTTKNFKQLGTWRRLFCFEQLETREVFSVDDLDLFETDDVIRTQQPRDIVPLEVRALEFDWSSLIGATEYIERREKATALSSNSNVVYLGSDELLDSAPTDVSDADNDPDNLQQEPESPSSDAEGEARSTSPINAVAAAFLNELSPEVTLKGTGTVELENSIQTRRESERAVRLSTIDPITMNGRFIEQLQNKYRDRSTESWRSNDWLEDNQSTETSIGKRRRPSRIKMDLFLSITKDGADVGSNGVLVVGGSSAHHQILRSGEAFELWVWATTNSASLNEEQLYVGLGQRLDSLPGENNPQPSNTDRRFGLLELSLSTASDSLVQDGIPLPFRAVGQVEIGVYQSVEVISGPVVEGEPELADAN